MKFEVSRRHPNYKKKRDEYEFFLRAYLGGREFIESELFSHSLEDDTSFQKRKERASYMNITRKVINAFTNFIFATPVKRSNAAILAPFFENADRKGDDIDKIMRKASNLSTLMGQSYLWLRFDIPHNIQGSLSLKEVLEKRILPYVNVLSYLDVVDWSLDSFGNYNWALIRLPEYDDKDPFRERDEKVYYYLLTKERIYTFDEEGDLVRTANNSLGEIPLIKVLHDEVDSLGEGEPLSNDMPYLARTIFNWTSIIDEMIERQGFAQLVCPDDGELEEMNRAEEGSVLRKIGTSSVFTYPASAGHPPQFITPDISQLRTIWTIINGMIDFIYLSTALAGTREDIVTNSSRARRIALELVGATLKAKVMHLEAAENRMIELYLKYLNKERQINKRYFSSYCRDVNALSFMDYFDSIFEMMKKNISRTFNKALAIELTENCPYPMVQKFRDGIIREIQDSAGILFGQARDIYDFTASEEEIKKSKPKKQAKKPKEEEKEGEKEEEKEEK